MNSKITELYWKCNKVQGDYSTGGTQVLDVEKFAKLIVKECLSLCIDLNPFDAIYAAGSESQYDPPALLRVYENTIDQYYDAISKHFGVEE